MLLRITLHQLLYGLLPKLHLLVSDLLLLLKLTTRTSDSNRGSLLHLSGGYY
jgi:hypothetical protein